MIQFTRDISDKCDLRSCYMWLVMQNSISVYEISLHACILCQNSRHIKKNVLESADRLSNRIGCL